ncbi:hypothetical protein PHYBOEH_007144 [Phytophthora boehmeriae]|uniref:Peptidase S1 domain-containing protein n=1 Tax=Phytophthora boehmeriae TaxID=109152 RepID=A0A8T1WBQ9_9STRA|nr:hypothetical protein PHYBOEH_007144 [Phytophthora boehmeriae]
MKLTHCGVFLLVTLATFVRGYSFSEFSWASDLPASIEDVEESTGLTADEEDRIIGGLETSIDAFPYIVGIRDFSENYCAGVLIAPHSGSGENKGEQILVVERSRHLNYNEDTQDYDIGLLKLETPASPEPVRLCAANGSDNNVGTMATVFGWGATENSTSSDSLRPVDVEVISNEKCGEYFTSGVSDEILCAGTGNGADACRGDSGGPLVVDDVLIGIVSAGSRSCGETPGLYTRVASVLDYINDVLTYGINETNSQNLTDEPTLYDLIENLLFGSNSTDGDDSEYQQS